MKSVEMIAFDLDQTLTESKAPLDGEMSRLLCGLLKIKKVAVISGASFKQFENQFLKHFSCAPENLENLFLLPTNGAILYEHKGGWRSVYQHELSQAEKKKIFEAFEKTFAETEFKLAKKIYGELIEDRGTQVTFSGLGSEAPLALKEAWDSDHTKRKVLADTLRINLPDFSVSIGGATSIDITRKGVDKASGVGGLMRRLGLLNKQVLYVGDALFPGGNDASLLSLGIFCASVSGVNDTKKLIRDIIS